MYIVPEDDQQLQNFIHNVTVLRERHGLSCEQMAGILRITPQQLRQLENGEISSRIYVDIFFCLRWHFGISFQTMFCERI